MSADSGRFVLDAFALLAFLQNEPGAARVQELLAGADVVGVELLMSAVNFGEVIYTTEMRQGQATAETVLAAIGQLPIRVVEVDEGLAVRAAHLKAGTRMGYADCFAAALAIEVRGAVVTGDHDFAAVESAVQIEWLERATR